MYQACLYNRVAGSPVFRLGRQIILLVLRFYCKFDQMKWKKDHHEGQDYALLPVQFYEPPLLSRDLQVPLIPWKIDYVTAKD